MCGSTSPTGSQRPQSDSGLSDPQVEGFNWSYACHCDYCREIYRNRGIDPLRDRFALVDAWRGFQADFLGEVRERIEAAKPETPVSLKRGPLPGFLENTEAAGLDLFGRGREGDQRGHPARQRHSLPPVRYRRRPGGV